MAPFFYGEVNQPAGVRYPTEKPVLAFLYKNYHWYVKKR